MSLSHITSDGFFICSASPCVGLYSEWPSHVCTVCKLILLEILPCQRVQTPLKWSYLHTWKYNYTTLTRSTNNVVYTGLGVFSQYFHIKNKEQDAAKIKHMQIKTHRRPNEDLEKCLWNKLHCNTHMRIRSMQRFSKNNIWKGYL